MFVHQIEFSIDGADIQETLKDIANRYLGALRMNGQICGREWPLYLDNNRCVAVVVAPESSSIDEQNNNRYVMESLANAKKNRISIVSKPIAENIDSAEICTCNNPSSYVLFTTYLSLESPVRCLDCYGPIPLYKFPKMPSGEYYEVIGWQSDYQSCDSLQMNCTVLEHQATRQLSDVNSSLSKMGRQCCEILSKLVGKPFYYYLYRANGRSPSSEKRRRCPTCGNEWFIDESLHSIFDFKCDHCLLLSNLAWNVRWMYKGV